MLIRKVILAIFLILSCSLSNAAEDEIDWIEGVAASACARLPVSTCPSINWENHKNMINAITTGMLESVCATRNISQIEMMIDIKQATKECIALYVLYKEAELVLVK